MKKIILTGFITRLFQFKFSMIVHLIISIGVLVHFKPTAVNGFFLFAALTSNWLLWVFISDSMYTTLLKGESLVQHLIPSGRFTLLGGVGIIIALLWFNLSEIMGRQILDLYIADSVFWVLWMLCGCLVFKKTTWQESHNPKLPDESV